MLRAKLIGLLTMAGVFIAGPTAFACQPNGSYCYSYHGFIGAGQTYGANYLYGSQARINTNPSPSVCDAVAVWPMLANTATTGTNDFAQIGLVQETSQSQQYVFYEYANTSSANPPQELFVAPSGTNTYSVTYDGVNHTFNFYLNGTVKFRVSNLGWTPNLGEWFGEAYDNNDWIPGSVTNPTSVNTVQIFANGLWQSVNLSGLYSNTTYDGRFASQGTDGFSIYDCRNPGIA